MQSILNVRIDSALKERGDRVLSENGMSVSSAVRALWNELANTRKLPAFMKDADDRECAKQKKRASLEKLASLAKPSDDASQYDLGSMYDDMWAKYEELE